MRCPSCNSPMEPLAGDVSYNEWLCRACARLIPDDDDASFLEWLAGRWLAFTKTLP